MSLQIKCPSCSRSFKVSEDLTGKTVECGGCDTRFEVADVHIIREREKFYPGENKGQFHDRLGRAPARDSAEVNFQTASYEQNLHVDAMLVATPAQKGAVITGIAVLIITALFFLLGSGAGGPLQDVALTKRIILGGFSGLLGSSLVVFGAKNWRAGGVLLCVSFLAAIFALIFLRPIHVTPGGEGEEVARWLDEDGAEEEDNAPVDQIEALKKKVGYGKLTKEMELVGDPELVLGIYTEPYEDRYRHVLENFFRRKLQLSKVHIPGVYSRSEGRAAFFVYSGLDLSFDGIVSGIEALGSVKSYPELRLVEIQLNTEHFKAPDRSLHEKLHNPENPSFSDVNLPELRHIDHLRAKKAVERIDQVPEGVQLSHKPAVQKELIRLLAESVDPDFRSSLGDALKTWAGTDKAIAEKVGEITMASLEKGVPASIVDYLQAAGASHTPLLIDTLWAKNPLKWSEQYERLGAQGEARLVYHLQSSPLPLKKSSAEILRKVGTSKSLSALRAAKGKGDSDFDVSLDRAVAAIKGRQ